MTLTMPRFFHMHLVEAKTYQACGGANVRFLYWSNSEASIGDAMTKWRVLHEKKVGRTLDQVRPIPIDHKCLPSTGLSVASLEWTLMAVLYLRYTLVLLLTTRRIIKTPKLLSRIGLS